MMGLDLGSVAEIVETGQESLERKTQAVMWMVMK
jgi:hypothetical protein